MRIEMNSSRVLHRFLIAASLILAFVRTRNLSTVMHRALPIFAAVGFVLTGGCASVAMHIVDHIGVNDGEVNDRAYKGVHYDCRHLGDDQGGGILIFDIPLSAVVDTLLLPYDLSRDSHD